MKNQFIIPSIIIAAAILVGVWILKPPAELPKAPDQRIGSAIIAADLVTVRQHLAAGLDVNARDGKGIRPLGYATRHFRNDTIAEYLIDNGADVDAKQSDGSSYLHTACFLGRNNVAELLIAKGADVNAKNEDGETPLDLASLQGETEIADLLRKHGGKHGTIHGAAQSGDIEAVKQHLAAGAQVNAKRVSGGTALHSAASKGHKEVVELLIAKGADVNAKDGWVESSPLIYATLYGHKEIAELLIVKGADVNQKDRSGSIALHHVAQLGHFEVSAMLIAKGADVNAQNNLGETPLDRAIFNRQSETTDLLRKHGAKTGKN